MSSAKAPGSATAPKAAQRVRSPTTKHTPSSTSTQGRTNPTGDRSPYGARPYRPTASAKRPGPVSLFTPATRNTGPVARRLVKAAASHIRASRRRYRPAGHRRLGRKVKKNRFLSRPFLCHIALASPVRKGGARPRCRATPNHLDLPAPIGQGDLSVSWAHAPTSCPG